MKLSKLALHLGAEVPVPDVEIENLSIHSSTKLKRSLFLALQGERSHGSQFISQAIESGCVAVLTDNMVNKMYGVPVLYVASLKDKLWDIISFIYKNAFHFPNILGVTGTNGKTTIATVLKYLLEGQSQKCAFIGTTHYWDGAQLENASHTTPPSVDIARILHHSYLNGFPYCAMEISSHALKQERLGTLRLKGGIFTNLTRDHMDYHTTVQDYQDSKLKMLDLIRTNGVAVVNDNDFGKAVLEQSKIQTITVGEREGCDYRLTDIQISMKASNCVLWHDQNTYPFEIPLVGKHNLYNTIQAVALLHQLGFNLPAMVEALKRFTGVRGRLERVWPTMANMPCTFVDYAHTPDAMENVLTSVRQFKDYHRLWVVFGCGGDRDRTKRPMMAAIAEKYSDEIIVTDDNPRTESSADILQAICKGFSASASYHNIPNRSEAIDFAITNAAVNDMILVLGKGHETYQIIGNAKYHFDDREEVLRAFHKRSLS